MGPRRASPDPLGVAGSRRQRRVRAAGLRRRPRVADGLGGAARERRRPAGTHHRQPFDRGATPPPRTARRRRRLFRRGALGVRRRRAAAAPLPPRPRRDRGGLRGSRTPRRARRRRAVGLALPRVVLLRLEAPARVQDARTQRAVLGPLGRVRADRGDDGRRPGVVRDPLRRVLRLALRPLRLPVSQHVLFEGGPFIGGARARQSLCARLFPRALVGARLGRDRVGAHPDAVDPLAFALRRRPHRLRPVRGRRFLLRPSLPDGADADVRPPGRGQPRGLARPRPRPDLARPGRRGRGARDPGRDPRRHAGIRARRAGDPGLGPRGRPAGSHHALAP
jgi:hypothetical protein